jgi:hypothetical protein
MPYILTPRWARVVQRVLFIARYLCLGLAGVVGVLATGAQFDLTGSILIGAAFIALIGVSSGRFHFELVALWFLIGALVWCVALLVDAGRPTSSILVLALIPALAERLLHLLLVARRARRTPNHPEDIAHGAQ